PLARDLPGRGQAVDAGHLDVEDREVGLVLLHQGDGLVAPTGLADDLVALLLEDLSQVETDDRLVLGNDDALGHRGLAPSSGTATGLLRPAGRAGRPGPAPARRST